ncbi:hypothetical protein Q7A53_05575 [Halobacillus rhizosphaerae]
MEELKKALKELFESGDIEIDVERTYNEYNGNGIEISVLIDDELVYQNKS